MFRYFAGLSVHHSLPVYPIALFSYRRPRRPETACFDLRLAGLHVVRFRFRTVQLNRLGWRAFLKRPNPVAAALMSRMRIAPRDRPRVKAECLRMLATLQLELKEKRKLSRFADNYLRLNKQEQTLLDRHLARLPPEEREKVMEITTSWKEEGRAEGRAEGRTEGRAQGRTEGRAEGRREALLDIVLRLITKRSGKVRRAELARVRPLPIAELDVLAEDLLDFEKPADLKRWLDGRG